MSAAVVLIGDSIRLGYQPIVEDELRERVRVAGPEENCATSKVILHHLGPWVLDVVTPGSVVHLNAGLHDLRRLPESAGDPAVPPQEYERNLEEIAHRVRSAGVAAHRLCLATTTPVDDVRHAAGRTSHRHHRDVLEYNRRLRAVAARNGNTVHDLYGVIGSDPERLIGADGVHLTEAGNQRAGHAVARVIEELLATPR